MKESLCSLTLSTGGGPLVDGLEPIIHEVIKNIVKYRPKARSYILTEARIDRFKSAIKKISNEDMAPDKKKLLALELMEVQNAIKHLKGLLSDNNFLLFYKNVIEGQSMRSISIEYGIDTKTVKRVRIKGYKQLALYLYPDVVIFEMLKTGWW